MARGYLKQVAIAVDQLANAILGGWADETFSSRCWRSRHAPPFSLLRAVVDGLLFFDPDHCRTSFESERFRSQLPPEFRQ